MRGRFLVLASSPRHCVVCGGGRRMAQVAPSAPARVRGAGPVACPHCGPDRLPVAHLRWRTDTPRGAV